MKRNRWMAGAIALAMTCSLWACSGSTGSNSETTKGAAGTTTAATEKGGSEAVDLAEGGKYSCSDEPLTLTAHIHWNNGSVLNDKMIIPKEFARYTNITLEGVASELDTDSAQAFNLMIANKTLPDIVGGKRIDINKYGVEGAFQPLNDLIKQYAPDIDKLLEENPDIKGAITAEDGNIYQIPFVYGSQISETWFIREDWLDAVGKEVPTTVEELHDVLVAFVNEDANGNGEKDEIGYFMRETSTDNKLTPLLSLFGVSDFWHTDENGVVSIGTYSPEYKEAIKNVSQWYAEGLIDAEIFTRDANLRETLFTENNGGLTHDWVASTSGYNKSAVNSVPGFHLVGMLPPTDINGEQWEVSSRDRLTGSGWAISVDNQHTEETMKYMNFYFTDTGRRISTYGVEGVTYNMVDGKPVYTDDILNSGEAINGQIMKMGGMIEDMAYLHDNSYEAFAMDEEGARIIELYTEQGVVGKKNPKLPALSFTAEENNLIVSKYPACRAYMLEQLQKWTFNGSDIDNEFDRYMQTLKEMGMDEIVQAYQNAYDRTIQK